MNSPLPNDEIDSPPPTKRVSKDEGEMIEQKHDTASAKLWTNKLGGDVGVSWMKILSQEFKKPYFTLVSLSNNTHKKGIIS